MAGLQDTNPDAVPAGDGGERLSGADQKRRMRDELRRKARGNPGGDSAAVVREIAAYLADRPALKTVAVFAALPGEVDLRSLPGEIGRVWAFPRVEGNDLVFHVVGDFAEDLQEGAFGIMEPKPELEQVRADEIDVFLCPGLGFDPKGGRIGRGRGFYDRMLARARPDAIKLGVCFSSQLVIGIVMEAHDVRMDGVIAG